MKKAAIVAIAAIALVGGGWAYWPRTAAIARNPHRNVLLVTIDTLRADALGSYGGPPTPALDRLAAEGLRFPFAHAHAVMTLPSHASILTGLLPFEHGIRDNVGYRLRPDSRTLASVLKARGFATAAFVSGLPLDSEFGLAQGFDHYDDALPRGGTGSFVLPERRAADTVEKARAWLSARSTPWFAWIHLFDPHAPYLPPPPYGSGPSAYHGEVQYVDAMLAPLLDSLRASADPTLVVVTSDHGEGLGDHGEPTHGLFAYESTLRVPLIITELGTKMGSGLFSVLRKWGLTPFSGNVPARHIDIMPTVLDAVGLEPGGRSLLHPSTLDDEQTVATYFEALSTSLNRGWAPLHGVIVGGDKWIDLPIPELYDLSADPREAHNLAQAADETRRVLEARLAQFDAKAAGRAPERAALEAQLQSLGYLSGAAPRKETYGDEDDPKRLLPVEQQLHRAVDAFQRGRYAEAAGAFEQALAARPDMALAYRHLAMVHWTAGRTVEAIATLERGLRTGVPDPAVRTQLASYLVQTGRGAEAVTLLQEVAGDDPEALTTLGLAYANSNRLNEAIASFERVLAIDPGNPLALENLGTAELTRGRADAAARYFERAVAGGPSAGASNGLGVIAMQRGDRETALSHWRAAVAADPSHADALYNLAFTLVQTGRVAEARPVVERFVRAAPPQYAREVEQARAWLARAP